MLETGGSVGSSRAEPASLTEILDRIHAAAGADPVTIDAVMEALGRRSFGPILLLAGLITLAPLLGDIPGVPTLMAVLVGLAARQLLCGRRVFWLPRWLLTRHAERATVQKGIAWLRRPARWLDALTRPRLTVLTRGMGVYFVAAICLLIALAMPPLELVPFSANGAGLALTAFGLALIGHDGLLALLAVTVTLATIVLVLMSLL